MNNDLPERNRIDKTAFMEEWKEHLQLHNLIPWAYQEQIKVRIYSHSKPSNWIALSSLCKAFLADSKYDIAVLVPRKNKEREDCLTNDGLRFIYENDYDIMSDKPDIVVIQYAYGVLRVYKEPYLETIYNHAKMVVGMPFILLRSGLPIEVCVEKLLSGPKEMDYYILDKLLYNTIEEAGLMKPNIIHIGNPKFDAIYAAMRENLSIPEEWNKLNGRKVFLWATDHQPLTGRFTFDLYASQLLHWFAEHVDDCALIIRPHPLCVGELLKEGLWDKGDYEKVREYCDNSENVIWDEQTDYSLSYKLADCVLTDVNCGIILSSLPLDKPICALRRYDGQASEVHHPEVVEHLNVADSAEGLTDFLERVRAGEDPKAEQRRAAFAKFISHYDGQNGRRIKDFIERKYGEGHYAT